MHCQYHCCNQKFKSAGAYYSHKLHRHKEHPKKRRTQTRRRYSVKDKAKILIAAEYYLSFGIDKCIKEVATRFNITGNLLNRWWKKRFLYLALESTKKAKTLALCKLKLMANGKFQECGDELYMRFIFRRKLLGIPVDGYWLRSQMLSIVAEKQPPEWKKFKACTGWLYGWAQRYAVSSQVKTDKKSVSWEVRLPLLQQFWSHMRAVQQIDPPLCPIYGCFPASCIWNMDQLPMPFALNPKRSYNPKNSPCWICVVGSSGLDKRQATVHLTLRAEGEQFVTPVIIFRGEGKRLSAFEKKALNSLTNIRWKFNTKAWATQDFCFQDLKEFCAMLETHFPGQKHLLLLDDLSAQKMPRFREYAMQHNVLPMYIPPGCTDLVQPVDHHVGAWLKYAMRTLYQYELNENLDIWRNYKANKVFSAPARRIMLANWLSLAWSFLAKNHHFIKAAFVSTGCLIKLDGSHGIKVRGFEKFATFPPLDLD